MNRATRLLCCILVVLALTVGLAQSVRATDVGEILAKPDEHYERTVTVSGRVVETFELVVRLYGVKDSTGQMRIKTDKPMPEILSEVEVTGTVVPEIGRDGRKYPVIKEVSRKILKEGKK